MHRSSVYLVLSAQKIKLNIILQNRVPFTIKILPNSSIIMITLKI